MTSATSGHLSACEHDARFIDRTQAAAALLSPLRKLAASGDVLVIGLARGGVPIARAIADALHAPLDVLVPRKIGVPGVEDVPLGVLIDGSDRVETGAVAAYIGVANRTLMQLREQHRAEVDRRVRLYRDGHPVANARNATVVLVDDGISSGLTMRAAARFIRAQRPRRIIAVAPVATRAGIATMRRDVDELVVLHIGEDRAPLASHYEHFAPLTDVDVMRLLGRSVIGRPSLFAGDPRFRLGELRASGVETGIERRIEIQVGASVLTADLGMPREEPGVVADEPRSLVILAHDVDASRKRYDTRFIAGRLRLAGHATLRLDLFTRREHQRRHDTDALLDASQLAARLSAVSAWAQLRGIGGAERIVVLGADRAAAAALYATSDPRSAVTGVIVLGARIDVPSSVLEHVDVPSLVIAGGMHRNALDSARTSIRAFAGPARLLRVARAGNRFEEPGALGAVAEHAVSWLDELAARRRSLAEFTRQYGRLLLRRA